MPRIKEIKFKPISQFSESDLKFITELNLMFNTSDRVELLAGFLSVLAESNDILSINYVNEKTHAYALEVN